MHQVVVDVVIETEVSLPDDPSLPYSWRLARRKKTRKVDYRIPNCEVTLRSDCSGVRFEGYSPSCPPTRYDFP